MFLDVRQKDLLLLVPLEFACKFLESFLVAWSGFLFLYKPYTPKYSQDGADLKRRMKNYEIKRI